MIVGYLMVFISFCHAYSLGIVCKVKLTKKYYATGWCKRGGGCSEFSIENVGNNDFQHPKIPAEGETKWKNGAFSLLFFFT